MTIANTTALAGPYYPNGVTTVFPFSFKAFSKAEIRVFLVDANGVETEVSPASYTATLTAGGGGSVVIAPALAAGSSLFVESNPDFTQNIQFENQSAFRAPVHTEGLDRGAARDIWLRGRVQRALLFPAGEQPYVMPPAQSRVGKFQAYGAGGAPVLASGTGNDSAFRTDVAANLGPLGGVKPERIGGVAYRIDDAFQFSVRLTAFGFKGDGVTDDTAAWRAAIAFAGARKISRIVVPAGVSVVSGQIVDAANPLPNGLTFVGEGPCDGPYQNISKLKYTGSGTCWNIYYATGGPASIGGWSWERICFQCTNAAGTMFDFGDTLNQNPHDVGSYMFLQGINFRGITAFGANGTGDFIRACKVFELNIDATSSIYSFRRGVWLHGCDNNEICARMAGNNRAIMIEKVNEFGNNNRINIHYVGNTAPPFGGEPAYQIWDSADLTLIEKGILLEGDPVAHMYLNGFGTQIMSPQLGAAAPFFELGPSAAEISLYSPRCTVVSYVNTPIINPPLVPNFGGSQLADFRIRIYDAPSTIQNILPEHPRILVMNRTRNSLRNSPDSASKSGLILPGGAQERSLICTAYNYWGAPDSPGGGGIKEFVQDATINNRWVMRLTKDTPVEQGICLHFRVGEDIQPGIYRLVNRMRLASGASNAGWGLIAIYDGAFFSNAFTFATGAAHATYSDVIDLSAAAYGKTFSINLYNNSGGATGVDLFVEAMGLVPVLDTGWTAGTGTPNKAAFAAYAGQTVSAAYAQAEAQAVANAARDAAQRVLALEQALRRQAIIN